MSLSSCCVQGYKHEGTPVGSIREIAGVRTFPPDVTLPDGDYDRTKALIFLTDVFGVDALPNGLLQADSFASRGLATYVVDYLGGEQVPYDAYQSGNFDLMEWLGRHPPKVTALPLVNKVQDALRAKGVERFGCVSFCYGGRIAADKVLEGSIDVAVTAHPSLLAIPGDFEAMKETKIPFLFNNALEDFHFTRELQQQAAEIVKENKNIIFLDYEGGHGFAIRGDPSDPKQRKAADECFDNSVEFLKKNL